MAIDSWGIADQMIAAAERAVLGPPAEQASELTIAGLREGLAVVRLRRQLSVPASRARR
jgi:hypothetical protein